MKGDAIPRLEVSRRDKTATPSRFTANRRTVRVGGKALTQSYAGESSLDDSRIPAHGFPASRSPFAHSGCQKCSTAVLRHIVSRSRDTIDF